MRCNIKTANLLPIAIAIAIGLAKALALFPFHVDTNTPTLIRYRYPLLYPFVFVLVMFSGFMYSNSVVMPNSTFYFPSDAINLALGVMFSVYSLTLIVTYTKHYSRLSDIEEIFADCVHIWKSLDCMRIQRNHPSLRSYVLFLVKFSLPLMQLCVIYARLVYLDTHSSKHYVMIGFISFPNVVASLVPGLYYTLLLGVFYVLRVLNGEIHKIVLATARLDRGASRFRIQRRFCDLSDSLDAIGQVYLQALRVAQRITDLVMVNVLLWIMYKTCTVLLQFFTCYMYFIGAFSMRDINNVNMPIIVVVAGFLGIAISVVELMMFASMCWMTMNEVQVGLQILHSQFSTIEVDIRFQHSVELFSMNMIHHQLNINAYGIFPIDFTLIYSISTSILLHLLILIQFELMRRTT